MIVGGLVVMLDLDHAYPQVLHGPKPYTERSRKHTPVTRRVRVSVHPDGADGEEQGPADQEKHRN
jgi:hypothetical protein